MDIISLGLAVTLPAKDRGILGHVVVATAVVGTEQLPRNGRPVEVTPDRESYFLALPPSPAAEVHASLVQALTVQGQVPAQVEVALPPLADPTALAPLPSWSLLPERQRLALTLSSTLVEVATADGTSTADDALARSLPPSSLPASSLPPSSLSASSLPASSSASTSTSAPAPAPVDGAEASAAHLGSVGHARMAESKSLIDIETAPALELDAAGLGMTGMRSESTRRKISLEPFPKEADAEVTPSVTVAEAAPTPLASPPSVANARVEAVDPRSLATFVPGGSPPPMAFAMSPAASSGFQAFGVEKAQEKAEAPATVMPATVAVSEPPTTMALAPSMASATAAAPAALPNPVERSIVRQLSQQLAVPLATLTPLAHEHKSSADRSLVIRLTPPELGTVRVEMSQRDGQLVIRMYAEDPAVRQAIERMLPNLRSDLRQGDGPAQVITIEPSSSDRNGERSSGDRGTWQGQQQQQQHHERAYSGGQSARGSERPRFSLQGQSAVEPLTVVPRPRSLGSRSPAGSVDALA
jgi:hypothetical protein